jgi:glycine/D-amino acid oxidase-like deaminating enzyme
MNFFGALPQKIIVDEGARRRIVVVPDSLLVVGSSPSDPHVPHAFDHVGPKLAGITGRIISDLIGGQQPLIDLGPFRPGRFESQKPSLAA